MTKVLEKIAAKQMISMNITTNDSNIMMLTAREDEYTINRVSKQLAHYNQIKTQQLQDMIAFVLNDENCKSSQILTYFGEKNNLHCGICNVCLSKKNQQKIKVELTDYILDILQLAPQNSREIQKKIKITDEDLMIALQFLLEKNQIELSHNNQYRII